MQHGKNKNVHILGIYWGQECSNLPKGVSCAVAFTSCPDTGLSFESALPQIFPGNPVVGLQVVVEDVGADDQVAGVERVDLVPALQDQKIRR